MSKLPIRQPVHHLVPPIHSTARWARMRLGRDLYDSLFSFAVVRNPHERVVSQYEFIRQRPRHHRHTLVRDLSFEGYLDYLSGKPAGQISRQADLILDTDGKAMVKRLLRFESLASDFTQMCTDLGLPEIPALPHQNHAPRSQHSDHVPSDSAKRTIYELYRDDFDLLGYRP